MSDKPKKIIVDCDAGTDDAVALIILISSHKAKEIEIKGITCVGGNTHVDNVVRNVFRTLRVCGATDIPVFRGAPNALINTEASRQTREDRYHGSDGLGDVFAEEDSPDTSKLESEHGVVALHRIVTENPGEISLVCLAPLTNVALAIRMFPEFADSLREVYVMGGNSTAKGNITAQAEFNFFADPESVHIVFENVVERPLLLLPWETCLNSKIPQEWRVDLLTRHDTPIMRFIEAIESGTCAKRRHLGYSPCDALLATIVVRPEMIKKHEDFHADIELCGTRTRGQVVLDHLQSRKPNVRLVLEYDSEVFKEALTAAIHSP